MRPNLIPRYFLILALVAASFFSCNEKEVFTSEAIESYIPLQQGKYIVFRLDSLVFTNFGRTIETHRYQEMHEVDTLITDNLGRPSYRIFVYQRDSLGTTPWVPVSTYFITPLGNQFEKVENNLRFISMHLPLRDGYSWKGNKYLPTNPYGTLYNFSNDDNMGDWDYYYDGDPGSFSYNGMNYTDVYSVEQADENYNVPISDPNAYAARSRSIERFSKDIGLVQREYEMWEYQPNPGGPGGPYYTGFGITMWMIDHN
ncbi:MAG TPA: hypothetical protein PLU37_15160 [Chitinophagaceae bacterium]|nr:hypothetical protein [Chitinophagales bacterium]HPG12870.1 hypothetical protein [Chitinophagaceae bacterium]